MPPVYGLEFEQEEVPQGKKYMISTRDNSEYRWQDDPKVFGAFEIHSEPSFEPQENFVSRFVQDREDEFDEAQDVFEEMALQAEFVKACENIPQKTCCCGLIPDDDGTIKEVSQVLNRGWVKSVNKRLLSREEDFKIDIFVWNWHNATGKAETNILLIRFLERTKKRSASTLRSRSMSPPPEVRGILNSRSKS